MAKTQRTLVCRFCGYEHDVNEAEMDRDRGFWCAGCDGYTYLDPSTEEHRFVLLLEDKQKRNQTPPKHNVHLNKRLSPLRYPGGKSKFIPFVLGRIRKTATHTLVGAFAGGGIVELALLQAGVVQELVLNDLDFGIFALYSVMKEEPEKLIQRIQDFSATHEAYFEAQSIVKSGYVGCSTLDAAWALLVVNRLAYSGIFSANPLGGRTGSIDALVSRWNPVELCRRVQAINQMSDKISVYNMDACELIEEMYWRPNTTIFVDPPYVQKGRQLYRHYYDRDEHERLNVLLDCLYQGMPGADIILCYDDDPLIHELYRFPTVETVGRAYSI